ncbi:hypothetical protein J0J30_24140, partial [Vibrio vulnificus]|nr:hypothetical protein [Vibrio vulnificus]
MNSVKLEGPCSGPVNLRVEGSVLAPANPAAMISDSLFTINHVDKFTLNGGGSLDGQGQQAWKQNNCDEKVNCKQLPIVNTFF